MIITEILFESNYKYTSLLKTLYIPVKSIAESLCECKSKKFNQVGHDNDEMSEHQYLHYFRLPVC